MHLVVHLRLVNERVDISLSYDTNTRDSSVMIEFYVGLCVAVVRSCCDVHRPTPIWPKTAAGA